MNFKKFKASLTFRKYNNSKIILRFIEYKIKNFLLDFLVKLNIFKFNSKKNIDLGSFKDNSYINFFLYSLKDEYHFTYTNDENAKLGGDDPYSASKVAVENLIVEWKKIKKNKKVKITVARAGNVIGGGDWSKNRLIPDLVRNISKKKFTYIRRPKSIRPWQYVLKVLEGYLILTKKNYLSNSSQFDEPFNFGPQISECKSVYAVVNEFNNNWKTKVIYKSNMKKFKETNYLFLNSKKAKSKLNWLSSYPLKQTIKKTCVWYKNFYLKKGNIYNFSIKEIKDCLKI